MEVVKILLLLSRGEDRFYGSKKWMSERDHQDYLEKTQIKKITRGVKQLWRKRRSQGNHLGRDIIVLFNLTVFINSTGKILQWDCSGLHVCQLSSSSPSNVFFLRPSCSEIRRSLIC
jgi:hypothetical protein